MRRPGSTRSPSARPRRSASCWASSRSTWCRPSSRSASGSSRAGRLAVAALLLSGAGVYLGRFQRWNSWEVVTEPSKIFGGLARGLLDPVAHAQPLALSAFFAVAWCGGYALFYSLFRPHLHRLEDR